VMLAAGCCHTGCGHPSQQRSFWLSRSALTLLSHACKGESVTVLSYCQHICCQPGTRLHVAILLLVPTVLEALWGVSPVCITFHGAGRALAGESAAKAASSSPCSISMQLLPLCSVFA
jgi:hypothetical protein